MTGLRGQGRTGIRLWTHLPRWRYAPSTFSVGVQVCEGDRILKHIDAVDHRPAFVELDPGPHDLTVEFVKGVRPAVIFDLAVEVVDGQVVDYELVRPERDRGSLNKQRLPVGVRRKD